MIPNYLAMPVNITSSLGYWRADLPWYVPGATLTLARIIQPSWRVLEWGCGASTIFYARHCRQVTSIDASPRWVAKVRARLAERCPGVAADVRLVPAQDMATAAAALDGPYDLIAVDTGPGIDRDAILRLSAASLIAPRGVFVLDNYGSLRHWPDTSRLRHARFVNSIGLDPATWKCSYFTAPRWVGRGTCLLTTWTRGDP